MTVLTEVLHSQQNSFGKKIKVLTLSYSDLFHPDNIKNLQEGSKISVSLHKYWNELGGPQGLANGLNTHVKVPDSL